MDLENTGTIRFRLHNDVREGELLSGGKKLAKDGDQKRLPLVKKNVFLRLSQLFRFYQPFVDSEGF